MSRKRENASDQRLVRCIAWFCGELSVLENQRKSTDCEYESGEERRTKIAGSASR
jgi:hypothetical protein